MVMAWSRLTLSPICWVWVGGGLDQGVKVPPPNQTQQIGLRVSLGLVHVSIALQRPSGAKASPMISFKVF